MKGTPFKLFSDYDAAQMCGGRLGREGSAVAGIYSVAVDSRNVLPGSLFVALKGEAADGHRYIPGAVKNGAVSILVSRDFYDSGPGKERGEGLSEVSFIIVSDTLKALQLLAERYAERFSDLLAVGITGSSGKTTTKELLKSLFTQGNSTVATPGNLNSEIGLPLSVFLIRPEHRYGFFEMGVNFVGEMDILSRILKPHYAVVTNIGTAHSGPLGGEEGVVREKGKIFSFFTDESRCFVYENEKYRQDLEALAPGACIAFGEQSNASVKEVESLGIGGWRFLYDGISTVCKLPGKYNLRNIFAALAVAEYFHIPADEIRAGLEAVLPLSGRGRIIHSEVTVIEDSYNANAESMAEALDFLGELSLKGRKIAVLGSMKELGDDSERLHCNVGRKAAGVGLDKVFFYGREMNAAYGAVMDEPGRTEYFYSETFDDLKNEIASYVLPGDMLLLKGSRSMKLERLLEVLDHV